MRIDVEYYALMREQAGRSREAVQTAALTPAALYEELRNQYHFTLTHEQLRVAINSEFSEWQQRLRDGDAVVFIPPVAGG
jgi:molybdopterin converting factor small subunit